MTDALDAIAEEIDRLDNLVAALDLPMPANLHVQALRAGLPEVVENLKGAYIAAGGENHWEFHP
ncbi:hypothetical protein D9M68_568460 [compost metagenome]